MIFNKLVSVMDSGEEVDVFTIIDSTQKAGGTIGEMLILHSDGRLDGCMDAWVIEQIKDTVRQTEWTKPVTIWLQNQAGDKYRIFWDRMVNKFRAVVFGGGHISQPLVQILSLLDFEVTVI